MKIPFIFQADSYKYSHFRLFPNGTTNNFSYIEARGFDKDFWRTEPEVVFFGLYAFLVEHLSNAITKEDVTKAKKLIESHGLPFNETDFNIIVDEYNGYLPIEITALPEGSVVNVGQPMLTVKATDDRFAWLASFVETSILRSIWYGSTVATLSREAKKYIKGYLKQTSDNVDSELPFKLHDFGSRGATSSESAQIAGMAHLINFQGTDTVESIFAASELYGIDMAGFSVRASEHSTITSWGENGEFAAFENMVDVFKGEGVIISCVSDSYDIFNAVNNYWPRLKDKIVDSGSTLVVRPDSGNPEVIIPILLNSLSKSFGFKTNSKGYKVLENVRILWGDGIDIKTIPEILETCKISGFSTENLVLGMGGGLHQKVNRDTLKFAMKTSAIEVDGSIRDVYKRPITDSSKVSKRGVQKVENGVVYYRNGEILVKDSFDAIRKRAEIKH